MFTNDWREEKEEEKKRLIYVQRLLRSTGTDNEYVDTHKRRLSENSEIICIFLY